MGVGAVGLALARLLRERGEPVVAVAARNLEKATEAVRFVGEKVRPCTVEEVPRWANRILIAVRDDAIAQVAMRLAEAGLRSGYVLHTSGTQGLEPLAPLRAIGVHCGVLHPLQTLPSAELGLTLLRGVAFGVGGDSPAREWAREIAQRLGGRVLEVPDGGWPWYHMAAVVASNFLAALLACALELMHRAGISGDAALDALGPLLMTTARNVVTMGPERALTGPIQRGDISTVARHLDLVQQAGPRLAMLYRALGIHTLEIARRRGLDPAAAEALEQLLRQNG